MSISMPLCAMKPSHWREGRRKCKGRRDMGRIDSGASTIHLFAYYHVQCFFHAVTSCSPCTWGTRELGVLVDTLPVLRPQLLPSLQSRAFMGAVELQKTPPNLANLETITFGVLGTCELLKHICIVAHSTPSPKTLKISRGGKGGALPYKQVTCLLHYNISALGQGTLQRSTGEGSPWSPSLSPTSGIARLDRVDRSACAEFRALEALDAMLTEHGPQGTEGAEGTMMFGVTEPPCVSCLGRLIRFSAKYPKINVEAWIDGSLWRFGLEVGRFQSLAETQKNRSQMWTGHRWHFFMEMYSETVLQFNDTVYGRLQL